MIKGDSMLSVVRSWSHKSACCRNELLVKPRLAGSSDLVRVVREING